MAHNNRRKPGGYSLVLVILLLTVLISIVLGGNYLIQKQASFTKQLSYGQRAAFLSEAGIELGLLRLSQHLAGYEDQEEAVLPLPPRPNPLPFTTPIEQLQGFYSYALQNRGNRIPPEGTITLAPGESRTLALFHDSAQKDTPSTKTLLKEMTPTQNVTLSYATAPGLSSQGCLKWDISGFSTTDPTKRVTESVGKLLPCQSTPNGTALSALSGVHISQKGFSSMFRDYQVSTFLADHTQNYLTLTNLTQQEASFSLTVGGSPALAYYTSLLTSDGQICPKTTGPSPKGCFTLQRMRTTSDQNQVLPIFTYTLFQ